MGKVIRLTESDLIELVKKIMKEEPESKAECLDSGFLTTYPFYKWLRNEGERGTYVKLGIKGYDKLARFFVEVEPPIYDGQYKPIDSKILTVLDKFLQGWKKEPQNGRNVYYYIDRDTAKCENIKQFYLSKFLPIQTKLKSLGFENL